MKRNKVRMTDPRSLWRGAIIALVFAIAAVFVASCGGDDSNDGGGEESGPITIGFAIANTGVLEPFDSPARFGAQVAIEDINAAGGVDGRRLEAIEESTKSDPSEAANAAIKVLDAGADVLVVSCDFDLGGGTAAIEADKRGVLATSTCGASMKFGPAGAGDLVFTMATAGAGEGATMAEWAYEKRGWRRAFVIEESTIAFTQEVVAGFEQRWEDLGGQVVGKETMKNDDQSFAAQVSAIQSASPEPQFIFVSSYIPGEARLFRQIRGAGIDLPILGEEDIDGDYWKGGLEDLSNTFYVTYASIYGDDPNNKFNDLVDRYERENGELPDTAPGIMAGYSAVEATAKAIEETGTTDGEHLAEEFEAFKDEEFLVGPTTFTNELHINPARDLRIMKIQDGKSSFLKLFRPDDVPLPGG